MNVNDLLIVINDWGCANVTHTVHAINFEFQPGLVNARAGDSVQWVLVFGIHTVTSGDLCNPDGLFHEPLTVFSPTFTFALMNDNVGVLPYFCDPHCAQGMEGVIAIVPFAADVTHNGVVDAEDLLEIIAQWGPCA